MDRGKCIARVGLACCLVWLAAAGAAQPGWSDWIYGEEHYQAEYGTESEYTPRRESPGVAAYFSELTIGIETSVPDSPEWETIVYEMEQLVKDNPRVRLVDLGAIDAELNDRATTGIQARLSFVKGEARVDGLQKTENKWLIAVQHLGGDQNTNPIGQVHKLDNRQFARAVGDQLWGSVRSGAVAFVHDGSQDSRALLSGIRQRLAEENRDMPVRIVELDPEFRFVDLYDLVVTLSPRPSGFVVLSTGLAERLVLWSEHYPAVEVQLILVGQQPEFRDWVMTRRAAAWIHPDYANLLRAAAGSRLTAPPTAAVLGSVSLK